MNDGGILSTGSENLMISNNLFLKTWGIRAHMDSRKPGQPQRVNISNNLILDGLAQAIWFDRGIFKQYCQSQTIQDKII